MNSSFNGSAPNNSYADFENQCQAGSISADVCKIVNRAILKTCTWRGAPDSLQQCSDQWNGAPAGRALSTVVGLNAFACQFCLILSAVSLCGVFGALRARKCLVLVSAVCNALV
eukprot:CAMPEP_0195131890 /NCGR_PEP_ID=MMETSP0448-20130528/145921_1 /TAXON_ID=66468 /ORGANISM="Heterocapsa triquestra, Strain CCMP 448" /LENGTH=113 /DNA_ID=CAMNT_0040169871 /DNA_START=26 /DNA_END=363 /DNA_ORIENTATION=-